MRMALFAPARRAGARSVPSEFDPADGILLAVQRHGSTGSVLVGSGVLLPEGVATDDSDMSLWTVDGTEVSFGAIPLEFTHPDGTIQGVYVHRTADITDGTQYYLRTATPSTVTRESTVTPPRTPASFFVAPASHQCVALPDPYKLPTWDQAQAIPDQADWVEEYKDWIEQDDSQYSTYNTSLLAARIAIYGRAHSLVSMGLMRGESWWFKHALTLMDSGSTDGSRWLNSLAAGNIAPIGNEWNCDMIETYLCYMISGCEDYLLALDTGAKQLHDVARLGIPYGPTQYDIRNGWDRGAGRAFQAAILASNAGRSLTAGYYGLPSDSDEINIATLPDRAVRMLERVIMPDGFSPDPFSYEERSPLDVATDTTKVQYPATDQRDTVANGSVDITIAAETLTVPTGATMADDGATRARAVLLSWSGSAIVQTVGTMQTGVTYNSNNQPFRSYLPTLPAGHREIGHYVIFAAPGTTYTANTTTLPAHKGTSGGITAWFFARSRNLGYKPYMTGIALNGAMQFCDWYPSDPSAADMLDAIEAVCEHAWANAWEPTNAYFYYVTVDAHENGQTVYSNAGGRSYTAGSRALNTLMGQAFAWLGARLNSTTWRDRAKTVTDSAYTIAFDTGSGWSSPGRYPASDNTVNHRTGDEAHAFLFNSFYYRNQVT